jgi:signal transduction histidine kinase
MSTRRRAPTERAASRRPPIRLLILAVNALILLAPLVFVLMLRIYQTHLLHQTEAALIAESVWVGEVYGEALAAANGKTDDASPRPPGEGDAFWPVSPQFEPGQRILPRLQGPARFLPAEARDTAWFRAGTQVKPLLDRAKRVTLSGVRVLDPRGVVVASSGGELGAVLDDLPEVQGAMRGQYTVVGRERISDEPAPPLDGIRRRGQVRLFTALPVFRDGALVAVVRASRTGVDVIEALWLYRGEMSLALLACIGLTMSVAWALSRAISRPVRDLMDAARAITRGEARRPFRARGFVPAELFALSESLDALTAQLTERADYVAAFAAQAGHELKTPLTSIRGAVELLSDAGDEMPTAERARFLRNLTADTDRMERLVLRLLTLARLENPTAPPPEEDIPIRAWFEAVATRHGEGVRLHLASDLPPRLRIAPEHLEGAVLNLVDNALRHGAGAPIDLGVAPRLDAPGLVVEVRDRGPGLSEQARVRLFERFFTTERGRGGTGLGLAIAAAAARARGGRIEVESQAGDTRFTVTL